MLKYSFKYYHLSVFQNLRHSDKCNQIKSCIKHGRPNQSQRKLTETLKGLDTFRLDIAEENDIEGLPY